jgi:hypothetical protein
MVLSRMVLSRASLRLTCQLTGGQQYELSVGTSPRDPNPQFITGVFEEDWRPKVTKRYNLVQGKIR